MEKIRIHAFVSGLVQGISYRYYTKQFADKLGLKGWVKNLPDGRVEVIAEGNEKEINEMIKFLENGPEDAKILDLEIKKEEYKGEFKHFDIIH